MATQLYPTSDDIQIYDPVTRQGSWDKTSGTITMRLLNQPAGSGEINSVSENVATANYDVLLGIFVSDPIRTAVTLSGTLDAKLLFSEANADADYVLHAHGWVTQGDSATVRGTFLADFVDTPEFLINSAAIVGAYTMTQQTISSVAAQPGDRIVFELGYQSHNTHTTTRNGRIGVGGVTDVDGSEDASASTGHAPWILFNGVDIVFDSTYLYLVDEAAPVTPSANQGVWDVDNKQDMYFSRTKTSHGLTSRSVAETSIVNPTDGLIYRYVSDPLATQTIAADDIALVISQIENSGSADCFSKCHIYVMEPDGSVRGTLVANAVGGTEFSTSTIANASKCMATTCSSVSAVSGDRIVCEVGARFTNVSITSFNSTVSLGGGTVNIVGGGSISGMASNTTGVGALRFKQRILFADEVATGRSYIIMAD